MISTLKFTALVLKRIMVGVAIRKPRIHYLRQIFSEKEKWNNKIEKLRLSEEQIGSIGEVLLNK